MRKLATIEIALDILPIIKANAIELVQIRGWQSVVKKEEFKKDDSGVFFEIDSFLPVDPRYEFLRPSSYKIMNNKEGFRIRTMTMRGAISQGVFLPLHLFPELKANQLGDDVTNQLGIVLYKKPVPEELVGVVVDGFPVDIKSTDLERIQNHPEYLEFYANEYFEVSEKLNGESETMFIRNGHFGVCSSGWEYLENNNALWKIARILDLEQTLLKINRNIALQGEIIGEGIQSNPYKIKGHDFYLFNIWDIDQYRDLSPKERMTLFAEIHKYSPLLKHVPIIENDFQLNTTMKDILHYATGHSLLNSKTKREGLVFKHLIKPISFKVINNSALLDDEN